MPNQEKLNLDWNDPEAIPGIVCKVASVQPLEVTDEDLKKINKYTLSPVSADDVFIFKATMADNEQDDRNYMPFNLRIINARQITRSLGSMILNSSRTRVNRPNSENSILS